MVIYAQAGRLLASKHNLESALERRRNLTKSYNYAGSWYNTRHNNLDKVNINLLESVRQIKSDFGAQIRIRIEEPQIQFYAEDEATLQNIAQLLESRDCIQSINGPSDAEAEKLLKTGAILRQSAVDYRYKVIVRDGRYSSQCKQQLLNYLTSLGDEIRLTKGCIEMLNKTYPSMWGIFFYTNDPNLVTFIHLIDPTLISNIHELVNTKE